ncbi:MAG: IPT/TIG domain-containing protein [Dehalococcoidia bacterium]
MHVRRTGGTVVCGLLLLMLVTPQMVLADGPVISGVSWTTNATNATISWTVNTTSTITQNRVNYGLTTSLLGQSKAISGNVTNPQITLEGLAPGTKYYFAVESTDASGTSVDDNGGAYYSFITVPPTGYFLVLEPACGVCGELVEVGICGEVIAATAFVPMAGSYYISWDTATNVKETFTASAAGVYEVTFFLPEAAKGLHTVHLADNTFASKATANFEVNPFVRIGPTEGPVGTVVTLNGYGFAASQQIQVKFKGTVIGAATANSVGSWTTNYTIPATPAGGYTFIVEAKEGTDFYPWVAKYFKVTPRITVTPPSETVGRTVEISGTGFGAREPNIEITFDRQAVKKNIYADENGSWRQVIVIPPVQSGLYIIDASGMLTRARDVPDVEFIVGAGVLVEPNPAYVGDTIKVSGGGFAPGETGIRVTFDGTVVATVTSAGINGCWQTTFVLPPSAFGGHTVGASGDITRPAVENTLFTNAKIEGLSPNAAAPGDSVSLRGSGFGSSRKLTVTVGGVAATEDMRSQVNGDVIVSFRVPKGVTRGVQLLRVTDESGAADSVEFTVTRKTLASPLPTLPTSGSRSRSGTVTFHWQGITSGSDFTYTYILEISATPGGPAFRSRSGIEGLSYTLTKEEALPKGTYYWRVKAIDNYGNESEWSESSELKVSPIPIWVWVVLGIVVLLVLMVVAYRETKFKVAE